VPVFSGTVAGGVDTSGAAADSGIDSEDSGSDAGGSGEGDFGDACSDEGDSDDEDSGDACSDEGDSDDEGSGEGDFGDEDSDEGDSDDEGSDGTDADNEETVCTSGCFPPASPPKATNNSIPRPAAVKHAIKMISRIFEAAPFLSLPLFFIVLPFLLIDTRTVIKILL
jgi:hypothetical protein